MQLSTEAKIAEMNRQLFNKKETILLLPDETANELGDRVSTEVLAGMLANLENLGYQFSPEDIKKMLSLSEETLVNRFYEPVLQAAKEAKGADVEHHILFKGFPETVRNLDIDTLSDFRFFSYFTMILDEYFDEVNAFEEGSMTSRLQDTLEKLAQKDAPETVKEREKEPEKEKEKQAFRTIRVGTVDDYYDMVRNMLAGKTSLSPYDKEIVRFALDNLNQEKFMPESIPFKETWTLVAVDHFNKGKTDAIDIQTFQDFERLLAGLTKDAIDNKGMEDPYVVAQKKLFGDISLSKKQHFRNFTAAERKELKSIFLNGIQNNAPTMLASALSPKARRFYENVLVGRLHVTGSKNPTPQIDEFARLAKETKSRMAMYEMALREQNYEKAAEVLHEISPGSLARHGKMLVAKETELHGVSAGLALAQKVAEYSKAAPMDVLFSLKRAVQNDCPPQEEPLKFYFKKSESVIAEPFENKGPVLPEEVKAPFAEAIEKNICDQLSSLEDIGKVYIDPAMKDCPVPVVGRSDSGKNRTVATGTQLPVAENAEIIRAALYKQGPRNGFFDFSCAIMDKDYQIVGQVSWNNLIEGQIGYHSGDCADTMRGVTEVIDIDLKAIREDMPNAKYIVYEGMAWNRFTTVDQLNTCFITLSPVGKVGEDLYGKIGRGGVPEELFDPAKVDFRVDLTGPTVANIPLLYDIDNHKAIITNMAVRQNLEAYDREQEYKNRPNNQRHFDLPESCQAIENYAGELALTSHYIVDLLPKDKMSLYELASLNVKARNGELVETPEEADVLFLPDRKDLGEDKTVISPYDKDVITTQFMVPKIESMDEKTVSLDKAPTQTKAIEINMDEVPSLDNALDEVIQKTFEQEER